MGQTQVIRNGPADIIMTDYAKNVEIVNKPDPKWRRKSRIPDDGDPVIPFCALRYFTFVRVCWYDDTLRYSVPFSLPYALAVPKTRSHKKSEFISPKSRRKSLISAAMPKMEGLRKNFSKVWPLFLPRFRCSFVLYFPFRFVCAFRSLSKPLTYLSHRTIFTSFIYYLFLRWMFSMAWFEVATVMATKLILCINTIIVYNNI